MSTAPFLLFPASHDDLLARRPVGDASLVAWRTIAQAGPLGMTARALAGAVSQHIAKEKLRSTMQSLVSGGYARFTGHNATGRWRITGKPPKGEELPNWAAKVLPADAAHGEYDAEVDEGPLVQPPSLRAVLSSVPNSVFSVGPRSTRAWGIKASGRPEAQDGSADASEGARGPVTAQFQLSSDGVFTIELPGEDPISLPPAATRALFRWLDVLGGTSLQRLVTP